MGFLALRLIKQRTLKGFRGFAEQIREVAQLVAHYVRDVGVGCSSHLFSTKRMVKRPSFLSSRDSNTRVLSPSGTIIAGRQCSSHLFSTKRMVIRPSFLSSRDSNTRVLSPSGTIIAGRQCSSHLFSTKESSHDGSFCCI